MDDIYEALGGEASAGVDADDAGDESDAGDDPKDAAAQALVDAVGSGDTAGVRAAMQAFYDACIASGENEDDLIEEL